MTQTPFTLTVPGPLALGQTIEIKVVAPAPPAPPPAAPLVESDWGLDISRHNTITDWSALGRVAKFVFVRATMGANGADDKYRAHWAAAAQAGIPHRGVYHLFVKDEDPARQAENLLRFTKGDLGNMPIVADVELRSAMNETVPEAMRPTVATRLMKFLDECEKRSGRVPIIYTSKFMWQAMIGNTLGIGISRYPLFAADYTAPLDLPFGWERATFHQRGVILPKWAGGPIDDDVYLGGPF